MDHDREVHDVAVQNDTFSVYNLEQWNTDGGSFCVCPALQPGVYQFVFRVDNGDERELKISDFYDRTFLGNGRAVNYIELTGYSEVGLPTTGRKSRNDRKLTRCTSQGDPSVVVSTSNKESYSFVDSNSQHTSKHTWKLCTLL